MNEMSDDRIPSVLCFGEILWDFLPDGLFPGGAPTNVAVHLRRHGVRAGLLSAVGRDSLGDEILRRLHGEGVDTTLVGRKSDLPTGVVRAKIGAGGDATYEIVRNVAWDHIEADAEALQVASRAQALVFGSLALRSPNNRRTLGRLLAAMDPQAWRVVDVNLRPPHDDLALVRELAPKATLLKLNAEEAARLAGRGNAVHGREEDDARKLAAMTGCPHICVTAAERGAGMLVEGEWIWEEGRAVEVADTVGAGDAFLAALVAHLLRGDVLVAGALAHACRLGEWVASQRGATPTYADGFVAPFGD